MVDATESWDEPLHPERETTRRAVRVVVAEGAHAPGPLHYLLEGEGFQVLGSASDDAELTRLLTQSAQPEVIVVDAAVPAATALVAHEFAPASELIVIWPEDVVPPPGADQVLPELVFQDLGPAVQRAAERNRLRHPTAGELDDPGDAVVLEPASADVSAVAARRTGARVLVGTVAVIASIIVTMGVSFALQGLRASHVATPDRPVVASPSTTVFGRSAPSGGARPATNGTRPTKGGCTTGARHAPNTHASGHAKPTTTGCPSQAGGANGGGRGSGGGPTNPSSGAPGAGTGGHGPPDRGNGNGPSGTHGPSDHPTGPAATPAAGEHASPKS